MLSVGLGGDFEGGAMGPCIFFSRVVLRRAGRLRVVIMYARTCMLQLKLWLVSPAWSRRAVGGRCAALRSGGRFSRCVLCGRKKRTRSITTSGCLATVAVKSWLSCSTGESAAIASGGLASLSDDPGCESGPRSCGRIRRIRCMQAPRHGGLGHVWLRSPRGVLLPTLFHFRSPRFGSGVDFLERVSFVCRWVYSISGSLDLPLGWCGVAPLPSTASAVCNT